MGGDNVPGPSQPGPPALAGLTADALTSAGFTVTGPDDSGRLLIAARLAECLLIVLDDATAELHWTPQAAARAADPHCVADLAAALLAGSPCPRHDDAKTRNEITFKGIAGMDLRAGGYTVRLDVHTDDYYYDVTAELTVTNPRVPGSGTVYITDQGGLTWQRDYRDDYAENPAEPDPAATASTIAATIKRALTTRAAPNLAI